MQWPLHAVYVQYTQYSAIATIVISQLVDCVSAQKYSIPKAMARALMTSIFVTLACNYIHNSNACVWSWSSRKEVHIYILLRKLTFCFRVQASRCWQQKRAPRSPLLKPSRPASWCVLLVTNLSRTRTAVVLVRSIRQSTASARSIQIAAALPDSKGRGATEITVASAPRNKVELL